MIKPIYKPRFIGYSFVTGLILIFDGICTILLGPFGFAPGLYADWCVYNLKKDVERRKKALVP